MTGSGGSGGDNQTFSDLCALIFTLLRSPPPHPPPRRRRPPPLSPAGFAVLLLGASLAMMLCGSVTFVIGFIMMPWVLGLLMLFYLAGALSGLGRAILAPASTSSASPKEIDDGESVWFRSIKDRSN